MPGVDYVSVTLITDVSITVPDPDLPSVSVGLYHKGDVWRLTKLEAEVAEARGWAMLGYE